MKNWLASCGLGLVCAAFLVGSPAQAIPLTWTLNNFVFDDGGTASGSFVFDATAGTYSAIAITTTLGASLPGQTYDTLLPAFGGNSFFLSVVNSNDLSNLNGKLAWVISFKTELTNLGGIASAYLLADAGPPEGTCLASANGDCSNGISVPFRQLISGEVSAPLSATPLPAALPLFLTGVAALGLVARRRKQKQLAA